VARPAVVELRFTIDGGDRTFTWRDEVEPEERLDPLGVQFRERVTVEVRVDGEPVPGAAPLEAGPTIGGVEQAFGPVRLRGRVTLPVVLAAGPPVTVDEAAGPPEGLLEPKTPDAAPLEVGLPMADAVAGWHIAEGSGNSRQLLGLIGPGGVTRPAGLVAFADGRVHDLHLQLAAEACLDVEERMYAAYGEPAHAQEAPLKSRRWSGQQVIATLSFAGERCTASWRAATRAAGR
jgi:hypothetical protein